MLVARQPRPPPALPTWPSQHRFAPASLHKLEMEDSGWLGTCRSGPVPVNHGRTPLFLSRPVLQWGAVGRPDPALAPAPEPQMTDHPGHPRRTCSFHYHRSSTTRPRGRPPSRFIGPHGATRVLGGGVQPPTAGPGVPARKHASIVPHRPRPRRSAKPSARPPRRAVANCSSETTSGQDPPQRATDPTHAPPFRAARPHHRS